MEIKSIPALQGGVGAERGMDEQTGWSHVVKRHIVEHLSNDTKAASALLKKLEI